MVLKSAIASALCTGLLMWGGAALADEYRANEFLGLDLSQAVLSPKRLGPETQFAPVRIEARTDRRPVKTERVVVSKEAAPKPQIGPRHSPRAILRAAHSPFLELAPLLPTPRVLPRRRRPADRSVPSLMGLSGNETDGWLGCRPTRWMLRFWVP